MEIYLDANATTPVLAQAAQAAMQAFAEDFGNPSSVHSTGLKARALMDAARARAQRLLAIARGHPGLQLAHRRFGRERAARAAAVRAAERQGADLPAVV